MEVWATQSIVNLRTPTDTSMPHLTTIRHSLIQLSIHLPRAPYAYRMLITSRRKRRSYAKLCMLTATQITKSFKLPPKVIEDADVEREKHCATAFLPYISGTTDKVSRLLRAHNIKTTFRPHQKINTMLRNAKQSSSRVTRRLRGSLWVVPPSLHRPDQQKNICLSERT